MARITDAAVQQLVVSLQIKGLAADAQLKIIQDFRSNYEKQTEPEAREYIDRQIKALKMFCS